MIEFIATPLAGSHRFEVILSVRQESIPIPNQCLLGIGLRLVWLAELLTWLHLAHINDITNLED